jgi:putative NADH-flavin reductase
LFLSAQQASPDAAFSQNSSLAATDQLIGVTEREIAAVKKAGSVRIIVVGGAGSLEVAPGVSLIKSGHLPQAWMAIAKSHEKALRLLEASDVNWTYFSPAAFFELGERTGKFRLGKSSLVADEKGNSRISLEDYAIALVDEIEKPAHERQQFTINVATGQVSLPSVQRFLGCTGGKHRADLASRALDLHLNWCDGRTQLKPGSIG